MQKSLGLGINELTAGLSFKHDEIHRPKLKTLDRTDLQLGNKFQKKSSVISCRNQNNS